MTAVALSLAVADHPDAAAVIFGDQTLTYRDLDTRANRVANLLASRGIVAGDRVALTCPNVPYFVEVFWGVAKVGAELVPIDIRCTVEQVAERAAGCRAHFAFEGLGPILIGDTAWAAHDGEGEFFLITLDTGFPEPLEPPEFYHPLIARQSGSFAADRPLVKPPASADPDGRWLVLVPLADDTGWPVLVEAAAAGAAVVLLPQVSERLVAETRERVGVTREIG